jgi:hypothetical protein
MELALNLIWAVLALVSYSLLFRYLSSLGGKLEQVPSRSQSVVALTCVLAIVFPIISLSDDLQEVQATVEDASSSVLAVKKCVIPLSLNHYRTLHRIPFLLASLATSDRPALGGFVGTRQIVCFSPSQPRVETGRSPPFWAIDQNS